MLIAYLVLGLLLLAVVVLGAGLSAAMLRDARGDRDHALSRRAGWRLAAALLALASAAVLGVAACFVGMDSFWPAAMAAWSVYALNGAFVFYLDAGILRRQASARRQLFLRLGIGLLVAVCIGIVGEAIPKTWIPGFLAVLAPLGFALERRLHRQDEAMPLVLREEAVPAARAVRLSELAQRCGFADLELRRIDDADLPLYNAQACPGRPPRVRLWDSLLRRLNGDEVDAVVAHELAHLRFHHHARHTGLRLLRWIVAALLLMLCVSTLPMPLLPGLLAGLALLPLLWFAWTPLLTAQLRRFEREADAFAAHHAGAWALAAALRKLDSFEDATSAYARFFETHPPLRERLIRLGVASA